MVSNILAVFSLVCLGLTSAAPNRPDDIGCNPVTYWDCQPLGKTSGLPSCDHEEVCSNVNGKTQCRHLPRADKCKDDSGKVCTKKTGETCMVIKTPTDPLSVEKIPLRKGEYLRDGRCQYTCKETGGCSTQLVVDWANVTENWTAKTLSECASTVNNGECRERVAGCEDCNKVIDCEKEKAPENGVERLTARTCSNDGGEVSCTNSCPGDYDYIEDNYCTCGIMVYKQGRQIFGDEMKEYGIFCFSAVGTPLTELTALAGIANFPSSDYGPTTRDSDSCSPGQCRRRNKCCDVWPRRNAYICPAYC